MSLASLHKTRKNSEINLSMDKRDLARAILWTLDMWSDPRYSRFLGQITPGLLDKEWFNWFVGAWRVARTIKQKKRDSVRQYLDGELRQQLAQGRGARAIDDAAQFIQLERWSAQELKNGGASLPLSLVSKIGFMFCPDTLIPYDRFAWGGLNRLRREAKKPQIRSRIYCSYLAAFNEMFAPRQKQIRQALSEHWVTVLARKLNCFVAGTTSPAMERKVFDNFLMQLGRR
jgi:hypothetical protein